jgi:hypothetical protein
MYKTATILYLVILFLYILFSRQPDFFESEFTRGVIIEKQPYHKSIQYQEGKEIFTKPIKGWGASKVAAGDTVKVIFDPTNPGGGTLYSFFSYWLTLPELLISAIIYIVLFIASVFITGKQEDYYYTEDDLRKKRRYDD